ncbi:dipeptidase [Dictyobacter alpinus]|uniref:Dipeptidase n=1 Tax=Dictyobacter alpinus TaxID=2014873 RepID=A0A402BBA3_9CHLR|nr:M20/M25/M40 family metallo-hydrolase [Dictyobacter alpinus]GCE28711.1 dipeptidase [Dictyobacter alpinus]
MLSHDAIREAVAQAMPAALGDLARLVAIPSVATEGFPKAPVVEAAHATLDILQRAGVQAVRLLDQPTGYPSVYGEIPGPAGAPTVLLYAHYDVQPAGNKEEWQTPPFELTARDDGRLYGRGAADDKSGIAIHVAALRSLAGHLPVNIKIIVEGEEEFGSSLEAYVAAHPELFQADVVVVADGGNDRVGEPILTTSLRGMASLVVEVRTLQGQLHSGGFGGPTPDALVALIRMLSTLHDDKGGIAIPGLQGQPWHGSEVPEDAFRYVAGVLPGVELVGTGSIASRLWSNYAINVTGLDAPAVTGARNILIDAARARVSLRVPPGQSAREALAILTRHLESVAPWHVQLSFSEQETGEGHAMASDGPAYQAARAAIQAAYGKDAGETGSGGSIPVINTFASIMPQAEILIWGAEDGAANVHAPNESVDPKEIERAALAEAIFLASLTS